MFQNLFKSYGMPDIYIDLGTANTLVVLREKGLAINEPTVIAFTSARHGKKNIVAVGNDAIDRTLKTPGNLFLSRPLKEGVIADFDTTEAMLRLFISRPGISHWLARPKMVISLPYGVTDIEKDAVIQSGKSAGARDVILVEEPMVAAIGAGLPVQEPTGSLLIDFGGGTTEVAVIALSDIVYCTSLRVGGHKLNESIVDWVKKNKHAIINETTAEELKIEIGSALPERQILTKKVTARNANSGLAMEIELTSKDMANAIKDDLEELIRGIKNALENTPPELLSDIIDRGITLAGGGCLLRDLDIRIQNEIKIPVKRADNPLTTMASGGEKILQDKELLERIQLAIEED